MEKWHTIEFLGTVVQLFVVAVELDDGVILGALALVKVSDTLTRGYHGGQHCIVATTVRCI